jgi:hypothetical protein
MKSKFLCKVDKSLNKICFLLLFRKFNKENLFFQSVNIIHLEKRTNYIERERKREKERGRRYHLNILVIVQANKSSFYFANLLFFNLLSRNATTTK